MHFKWRLHVHFRAQFYGPRQAKYTRLTGHHKEGMPTERTAKCLIFRRQEMTVRFLSSKVLEELVRFHHAKEVDSESFSSTLIASERLRHI